MANTQLSANQGIKEIKEQLLSPTFLNRTMQIGSLNQKNASTFVANFLNEFLRNPTLQACSKESICTSALMCAALGLSPNSAFGYVYLIPYKDTCEFRLGYRGMLQLIKRSKNIKRIQVHIVREKDLFEYELGLDLKLHHVPNLDEPDAPITFAYAYAITDDDETYIEVMSRKQLDKVKQQSKTSNAWALWEEEMSRKAVLRRLFKYLPISVEALSSANALEDRQEEKNLTENDVLEAFGQEPIEEALVEGERERKDSSAKLLDQLKSN